MTADDLPAVAAMNADPEVMRYFPAPMTTEQSVAFIERASEGLSRDGFGMLAVEWRDTREFVGCVGLMVPAFDAAFTPCVEVGWRVCRRYWRRGVATEAAIAVLGWGFAERGLDEIVAFTYEGNTPSRRVMEKLGMRHDPNGDFLHPRLPPEHPLRPHALYRLGRDEFERRHGRAR